MSYDKRHSGRKFDEMRPMSAKVGIVPRADGSAMFQVGKTQALAAVYGPRDLHPKFMQNPETGILRVHYNMMPFSGKGNRVRPGGGRRAKEISMVIKNSLLPVLDLKDFPNAVVDVFVELPQTDAGTRCAAITAAAMALADAGIIMKDLVCAVAAGRVEDKIVLDLDYYEDAHEDGADIPVAVLPGTGEVTLLQMDGVMTREQVVECITKARDASKQIYEVQKKALKDSFARGKSK